MRSPEDRSGGAGTTSAPLAPDLELLRAGLPHLYPVCTRYLRSGTKAPHHQWSLKCVTSAACPRKDHRNWCQAPGCSQGTAKQVTSAKREVSHSPGSQHHALFPVRASSQAGAHTHTAQPCWSPLAAQTWWVRLSFPFCLLSQASLSKLHKLLLCLGSSAGSATPMDL